MTKREKAIKLLHELIVNDPMNVINDRIVECVDALIDAARDSESAHTRAVQLPPAPAGAYYDGVNALRCLQCFTKYPCPEHHEHRVRRVVDENRADEARMWLDK